MKCSSQKSSHNDGGRGLSLQGREEQLKRWVSRKREEEEQQTTPAREEQRDTTKIEGEDKTKRISGGFLWEAKILGGEKGKQLEKDREEAIDVVA
jgi:hypothetical protein